MGLPEQPELPHIDLHLYCHDSGGDVAAALHATRCFLLDQLASGSGEVEIIHGKGEGKLRHLVAQLLDEYKQQGLVLDFYVLAANNGVTLAKLPRGRRAARVLSDADHKFALRTRPFETLQEQLRQQLATPPVQSPDVPLPLIDGEARLQPAQFATIEELARAVVRQRIAEGTPPARAPRRLPKGGRPQGEAGPESAAMARPYAAELADLAKEAQGLSEATGVPPLPRPGRGGPRGA